MNSVQKQYFFFLEYVQITEKLIIDLEVAFKSAYLR